MQSESTQDLPSPIEGGRTPGVGTGTEPGAQPLEQRPEPRSRTWGAQRSVLRELCAVGVDALALAVRVPNYWFEREAERAALAADLASPAPALDDPQPALAPGAWPARPLRVLVSWAEPSGEIHARNLIAALREGARAAGAPPPDFAVLGTRAAASKLDLELIGTPGETPRMGFQNVVGALPYYLALLGDVADHCSHRAPDVCVPIDSPSLHVPLGRIARRAGIPVVHFVTPQLWGWAPWRVGRYRGAIDEALSILPFEPAWFARKGVPVTHVGHPLQDELARVPATRPDEASPWLALLPGSRTSVVERNLPWMLARVDELARTTPDLRIAICAERAELAQRCERLIASGPPALRDRVEVAVGALHATLSRVRAAFSVSGTVLIDLLHHRLPTVVVYRLGSRLEASLGRRFLTAPYFASPNLLAGRAVLPEFAFAGEGPAAAVTAALDRAFSDRAWRRACSAGLDLAAARLGPPGAVRRAARAVLLAANAARPAGPTRPTHRGRRTPP